MPSARFVVEGRVQGVGFRAFVYKSAIAAGIHGEVWNTKDGAVEIIAQAEDDDVLDAFAAKLHDGPGYVQSVGRFDGVGETADRFEITETR